MSAALQLCCGRKDAEVGRGAAATGADLDHLRTYGLAGSPAQIIDRLGRLPGIGADRVYLELLDLDDLGQFALVATEVLAVAQQL